MYKRVRFICFVLLFCTADLPAQQDEIFYHVMQRSFYDSDGDLHGDLSGLREKLGYLQELGVTSILMLPLYHSEYYHNYFATDFETIDPEFGTMEDYHALVKAVHDNGMKLYMDMETQYITEDHMWWKESCQNPASPYTEYLIYNGPGNTDPESIVWDLTELPGYDGTSRKVTTVNLLSEKVLQYNIELFSYWVDPNGDGDFTDGVDGFRLDHMMDDLDWKGKFTNLFDVFWSPLIDALKAINPDLVFIAEQARWEDWGVDYLEKGSVDRIFAFNLFRAIVSFDKENILKAADSTFSQAGDHRRCMVFIENHDIDRFASQVDQHPGKLKLGAALNLLIGGTPSIYYGQELGMTGAGGFGKFGNTDANDIPRREAFEWTALHDDDGMALWYRDSGPWWDQTNLQDHDGISLAEQRDDPNALWNTYRKLIALRKKYPALITGSYTPITNPNPDVLTFLRREGTQKLVVIANLSDREQTMETPVTDILPTALRATSVYGRGLVRFDDGILGADLPAYGVLVVFMR